MRTFLTAALAAACTCLTGCGGGGGSGPPASAAIAPHAAIVQTNSRALDPLPAFQRLQLPGDRGFTIRKSIDAGPVVVTIDRHQAPGSGATSDLAAMAARAAKLWTRRMNGVRDPGPQHSVYPHVEVTDNRLEVDLLVGYAQDGCSYPEGACANHFGDTRLNPPYRDDDPVIALMPGFFPEHQDGNALSVTGFRILVHEFGHIFDHHAEGSPHFGGDHSDCDGTGVMCEVWGNPYPIEPTEQDFVAIRHHFELRPHSDHETFGLWGAAPGSLQSELHGFGVQVVRTLSVTPRTTETDRAASAFFVDELRAEASVRGTPSAGPVAGLGTATWSGDLLAYDVALAQPVVGDAELQMDLADNSRLDASFTGMERTSATGATSALPDLSVALLREQNLWRDAADTVRAQFHAVGGDPAGAVAGTVDHEARALVGAFGALRDP